MIEKIKKFVKDAWTYVWSKTTVDEKAVATAKEVKRRVKNVKEELRDVAKAIKEVGNQVGDIDNALRGEERKGRKNGKNK